MSQTGLPQAATDALRRALLERRRLLLQGSELLEEDLRAIEESRETEIEERGQQETMTKILERLGERDRLELEDIHRALVKIASGRYGLCEACGKPISTGRLEALPQTRWCVDCAQERERVKEAPPRPFGPGAHRPVPEEYGNLDDDELAEAVRERIRAHGDPDLLEIRIRCHGGVVRLSGTIGGEPQRQVLRQIVADAMGLDLIDRLRVAGADRAPPDVRERARGEAVESDERIPAGSGWKPLGPERAAVPEDEGEPPESAPDKPLAEEE
jgi:RNA polymerase-binding protein DksA